jgi:hypothetical protein
LCTNLILNPSPHEKDFEKEKFKSPPLLWRGVGGEVFLCTNLILNPSPHEKDFEKEEFKSSPLLWRGVGGEVFCVQTSS